MGDFLKNIINRTSVVCLIIAGCLRLCGLYAQDQDNRQIREYYRTGEIYYQHGLYDKAQKEFQKALELKEAAPAAAANLNKNSLLPPIEKSIEHSTPPLSVKTNEYIICSGDTLGISVWGNPDLTQDVIVRPDGKISFPLIGEIQAQELTLSQFDEIITKKLTEFVRVPDVSISLRAIAGNKIIVLGEIAKPGVYALTGRRSVTEAVASAGGFTKDAVINSIVVITGGLSSSKARRVNLAKTLLKGNVSQDLVLSSQDIVYVPKKFVSNLSTFLREILDPLSHGVYTLKEGMSL